MAITVCNDCGKEIQSKEKNNLPLMICQSCENKNSSPAGRSSGLGSGTADISKTFANNVKFNGANGHGFAAEEANNLKDIFDGKDAKVVGGNNEKNGPDRLVDGKYIQTKYYKTGKGCVDSCFKDESFRYKNPDGTLMQIEVPSDKYSEALKAMEEKIRDGKIPGITDTKKAKDIIKKGSFTYKQAKNIAKFGTVEGLTFDAINGVMIAGAAMGISSAMTFVIKLMHGESYEKALEVACVEGLKVGGITLASSILTAQIGRTSIEQGLRGLTDIAVNKMGTKAAQLIANSARDNAHKISGASAKNCASKIIRGNVTVALATTLVLSTGDLINLFNRRISKKQAFKNISKTAASVTGATTGAMIGAMVANVPGALIGSVVGSLASSKAADELLDFIEDDAEKMYKILQKVFSKLSYNHCLTEQEVSEALEAIKEDLDLSELLQEMYAKKRKRKYCKKQIRPIVQNIVRNRNKIQLPQTQEIENKTHKIIEFITKHEDMSAQAI